MARDIKITDIADLMEEEIQTVVRLTALEWTKEVKEQTPVFSLDNYTQEELNSMPMFFKVQGKTVPLKKALLERGKICGAHFRTEYRMLQIPDAQRLVACEYT